MNRPPRPRMMNNIYQNPRPNNHQWRPIHGPSAPFPWRDNSHYGAPDMRTQNSQEHWCETCDRGFPSAELLHKHNQQHQKCNIDGCQFVAHPKVITKHIQMQHSTGLYKKIANLNSPEDIQRWRDERKKKYPTKCNIEKKAAEYKEKVERGEKIALERGQWNHRHTSRDQGLKRKPSFDKKNQNQRTNRQNFKSSYLTPLCNNNTPPAKKIPKVIPSAPLTAEKNKLEPFTGILNIEMDDKTEDSTETSDSRHGLFEEDGYEELLDIPKETTNTQEPVVCGALSLLICDYGSSEEEMDTKEKEFLDKLSVTSNQKSVEPLISENNKVEPPVVNKPEIIENKANESDDDGPEEIKIVKTNVEHETAQEAVTKNKEKPVKKIIPPRNKVKQNFTWKRKIPSTLLQKLLHKEITQERNIVLQCIRYIKEHNYFDKPNQL